MHADVGAQAFKDRTAAAKAFALHMPGDLGREDARRIVAYNPENAATAWAEWDDASSADYTIVGGTDTEVVVAEDWEGSAEWRFSGSGESVPSYRARKAA